MQLIGRKILGDFVFWFFFPLKVLKHIKNKDSEKVTLQEARQKFFVFFLLCKWQHEWEAECRRDKSAPAAASPTILNGLHVPSQTSTCDRGAQHFPTYHEYCMCHWDSKYCCWQTDSLQLLWTADLLLHTAVFRCPDAKMLLHQCSQVPICSLSLRFLERKSPTLNLLFLLPYLALSFTEIRSDTYEPCK